MSKNLKMSGLAFCITMIASIATTIVSCKQDACKSVNCAYGENCKQGVCTCQPGYEGANCETISRDKFTGTWEVTQIGPLASMNKYAMNIQKDSLATYVIIRNLSNTLSSNPIKAFIINDSLTIAKQTVGQDTVYGVGRIYATTGTASGYNEISMIYHVAYRQGKVDEFVLNCTR